MEEGLEASYKAIEHWYTFGFESMLNEHVIVYGKYLDRLLP